MDRKKLVLLVGALVVAIGTALAARSMFAGAAAPQAQAVTVAPEPEGPKILVAKRAMPLGTIITADAIGYQLWPQELVQDAYFVEGEADMESMLGTVARQPITAGEPITRGSLVSPGDRGFLAAALGPGMRAITVPVSNTSGVGGFIFPGDHVDLLLTQTIEGIDGGSLKASETIMRNLRVLATDRSTDTRVNADGKTVVSSNSSVTLEVTPRIAEKITVAQQIGSLSLSLRAIADNQSELERAIASGAIDLTDGVSGADEKNLLSQARRRPQEGSSSYVTGGDVSRFESRVMPRMFAPGEGSVGASAGAGPAASRPSGPVVRVTRGDSTSEASVANGAGAVLHGQSRSIGTAGRTVPGALSTLR